MAIVINGNGIDMGNNPVLNASQIEVQENQVSPFSGFKNYIINGGFDIWQRGNSQTTNGYGSADRWHFGVANGLVGNLSRVEVDKINIIKYGGATFRPIINVTTAPNSRTSLLEQRIENPFRLSGKTVTVSFYARCSSVVGNIEVSLFSNKVKINSNDVNINVGTFTPTTEIVKHSFTYTLPIFDEKTIEANDFLALRFVVPSGFLCTNLGFTGVQLEEGSVATPFENRPIGLELSLCQRYYEIGTGYGLSYDASGTALQRSTVMYKVSKMVPPAIAFTKLSGVATAPSVVYGTDTMCVVAFGSVGASEELYYSYTASAEL